MNVNPYPGRPDVRITRAEVRRARRLMCALGTGAAIGAGIVLLASAFSASAHLRPGDRVCTEHGSLHCTTIPVPAACSVPATPGRQPAAIVPSGDAGYYWVPQLHGYQEFVCTDGTLVHVTGYGNRS